MSWNLKYWDMIGQLYWNPAYLGLKSIPQKHWKKEDGNRISVPAEMVNPKGPLYARGHVISALVHSLYGKEEPLNHFFNFTFAVAPDVLIQKAFAVPLGFADAGPFQSLGGETQTRYGWGSNDNITQHDALFVSNTSAVAVELKLESSTWPGQIAKYAALLTWEELKIGPRENLGLLFIAPEKSRSRHWRNCGLTGPDVDGSFIDREWEKPLPEAIQILFSEHREKVISVLDRLKLAFISWDELLTTVQEFSKDLDRSQPGDQTLGKLLDGFVSQLLIHRSTGLPSSSIDGSSPT